MPGIGPGLARAVQEHLSGSTATPAVNVTVTPALVLPGAFAGMASSIGVAVLGFKGMGDAVKALNDGDLEKATEAIDPSEYVWLSPVEQKAGS